ncbi:hypothetical protein CapIbe_004060 [Capra ibex]
MFKIVLSSARPKNLDLEDRRNREVLLVHKFYWGLQETENTDMAHMLGKPYLTLLGVEWSSMDVRVGL